MTVKMTGPANHGGFAYRGISYAPDEDGMIEIPDEALPDAMSHGFEIHVEPTEDDVSKEKLEKPAAAKSLKK